MEIENLKGMKRRKFNNGIESGGKKGVEGENEDF